MSPSARRSAALRAALRHPDAVGVRALNAWAAPAPKPAPVADAARRAAWDAARARPVSEAAMGAAHDARSGSKSRMRPRWAADGGPIFGQWAGDAAEQVTR